jgi:hypothetical protein
LPKLPARKFYGDPADFAAFWQSFTVSVHNQPISTVEKADYLLHMLEGEAKKATAGYAATEQDYPLIVEILQKEFGDADLVAESLHHELYNLVPPKDEKTSLRNFARQLDRICRQLGQQGLDEDAPALLMTAKGKLPVKVCTTLLEKEQDARDQGSPKWNGRLQNGTWQARPHSRRCRPLRESSYGTQNWCVTVFWRTECLPTQTAVWSGRPQLHRPIERTGHNSDVQCDQIARPTTVSAVGYAASEPEVTGSRSAVETAP